VSWRRFLKTAGSRSIVGASMKIALVVGTVLNLINQSGRISDGQELLWGHVGLNYLVPYCVATYSAGRNQLRNKDR
jgi:hypothetical protein